MMSLMYFYSPFTYVHFYNVNKKPLKILWRDYISNSKTLKPQRLTRILTLDRQTTSIYKLELLCNPVIFFISKIMQ